MKKTYTPEFKIQVAKEYLNTDAGYRLLARRYGVDKKTIKDWVDRYQIFGEEYFYQNNKGRKKTYTDVDYQHMTKDEKIHYLEMENEILKKANALILGRK